MNTPEPTRPLWMNGDELADALQRPPGYISAMKKAGFKPDAPPNFFTFESALTWLKENPQFRAYKHRAAKNGKGRNTLEKTGTKKKKRSH